MKNSMRDVAPFFDAGRMADEYYQKLYHHEAQAQIEADASKTHLRKVV
jgi:hypothetical protein